jgi:hypothetical protein
METINDISLKHGTTANAVVLSTLMPDENARFFEEIRPTSIRSDENCDRKHAKNRRFKTLQSPQGLAGTTGRYTPFSPHFRSIYKDTFDAFCR